MKDIIATLLKNLSSVRKLKYQKLIIGPQVKMAGFPVAQMVKNLPAMQETWVQFLGWEDPLEKGIAIHSSILAWRIPWTEKTGELQSMRLQRIRHD